jgi:hypothetical protein
MRVRHIERRNTVMHVDPLLPFPRTCELCVFHVILQAVNYTPLSWLHLCAKPLPVGLACLTHSVVEPDVFAVLKCATIECRLALRLQLLRLIIALRNALRPNSRPHSYPDKHLPHRNRKLEGAGDVYSQDAKGKGEGRGGHSPPGRTWPPRRPTQPRHNTSVGRCCTPWQV